MHGFFGKKLQATIAGIIPNNQPIIYYNIFVELTLNRIIFRFVCLLEFEDADEAGQFEDVHDVVVHATHDDLAATGFCTLQDAEQDAQSTGGNILQTAAVDDDILTF